MLFSIDGDDIRKYGSQGQQRTSALSLKLSEIDLVRKSIHNTPVLLLDDVLSELDSNRQNYLLNSITDIQTIITCTGLEEFVKNLPYELTSAQKRVYEEIEKDIAGVFIGKIKPYIRYAGLSGGDDGEAQS